MLNLHFAPLQGYTDAAYRKIHHEVCGGVSSYYTPFIRWERGGVRTRDLREMLSPENEGLHVVPQVIFSDEEELKRLLDVLLKHPCTEVDLNMGCPFPLQTKLGRGAALLAKPEKVERVMEVVKQIPEVSFSVKMRMGMNTVDEMDALIPILNDAPLSHVALHPRLGVQQYKGTADRNAFFKLAPLIQHPLIYNGDVTTLDHLRSFETCGVALEGVMIGRGLLARPTLSAEYMAGEEWTLQQRMEHVLRMHQYLFEHYSNVLQGEAQLLSKMQTFWEYMSDSLDKKTYKKIQKTTRIGNYLSAVSSL